MNLCIFTGYVAERVELKTTTSGLYVCDFDLGIPRRRRSGEAQTTYDYITIQAWRERAETCSRYLEKGTKITIRTTLKTETYEDKNKVKRKKYIFELEDFEFCEKKQTQTPATAPQEAPAPTSNGGQANTPPYNQMPQNASTDAQGAYGNYAPQFEELSSDDELPF